MMRARSSPERGAASQGPCAELTAVVLAGGQSRRFGSDKAMAPWNGATLLETVLRRVLRAAATAVVVSKDQKRGFLKGPRVRIARDSVTLRHPLAGLHAGLADTHTPWAFICACDMPFIEPELVNALLARRDGVQAVIPVADGKIQPLCGLYAKDCLEPLSAFLDEARRDPSAASVKGFLRGLSVRYVDIGPAEAGVHKRSFIDLDTRPDYNQALGSRPAPSRNAGKPGLIDGFGRRLQYLRISITDHCNFRCVYCMPAAGVPFTAKSELLSPAEIERVVRAASSLGIRNFRLTGGEPLVRPEVLEIIRRLAAAGIDDLSLTTNAMLLESMAPELRQAGLNRVNISLDTLSPERFRRITRLGELGRVLRGIEAALEAGLEPVKINAVLIKGVNDDEIGSFVDLCRKRPLHVRLIELMPIGDTGFFGPGRWMPLEDIRKACGPLTPCPAPRGFGPAKYFRPPGAVGTMGFISALSRNFCSSCNRMRLSSTGRLQSCLASAVGVDLGKPLRSAGSQQDLRELFRSAARIKPSHHRMEEESVRESFMCALGG